MISSSILREILRTYGLGEEQEIKILGTGSQENPSNTKIGVKENRMILTEKRMH